MCGITGIIYKHNYDSPIDIIRMNNAIAHRGPDGEGFIAINSFEKEVIHLGGKKTPVNYPSINDFKGSANIYLAHRRLSILDLSPAGHQPMSNNDKSLWITFNGEIYNYKELKNELKNLGFEFKSHTDTEVLLYTYEKWGKKCLEKLNGMFSFVIYDQKNNILFGARDRFGVKPLYFTNNDSFFAFNSEIKGLLANEKISRKINLDAAAAYLKNGLETYYEETMFENVFELLPSHFFIYNISSNALTISKYFELEFNDVWSSYNEKAFIEAAEKVKELVLEATRLRLNADVTVGSCLSGGIDSSSIVCSINYLLKTEKFSSLGPTQEVVTACFDKKSIDESYWAKLVAEKVNAKWIPVYPKRHELVNDLQDIIYSQDVPFGSTNIYAQYRVMKAARENDITVMLDGQGGDELFTGYASYYKTYYSEAFKNKEEELLKQEQKYVKNTPFGHAKIKDFYIKKQYGEIARFYYRMKKRILPLFIKPKTPLQPSDFVLIDGKKYPKSNYTTLNSMLYAFISTDVLPRLLKYEDRNSMRFSIESRTPFADDINLINYVFSLPGVYKIHNGWNKYLLRESMKGIIPEKVRLRTSKLGFTTPENDWLNNMKPVVFDFVKKELNEIINLNLLYKDWDNLYMLLNKNGKTTIWKYINFILWYNIFKVTL